MAEIRLKPLRLGLPKSKNGSNDLDQNSTNQLKIVQNSSIGGSGSDGYITGAINFYRFPPASPHPFPTLCLRVWRVCLYAIPSLIDTYDRSELCSVSRV